MDNDNPVKELIDEQLASDINEILETVEAGVESFTTHTKDLNNPHQVTKEQVGLGNVDNTSDLDKPISNAVASAINTLTENTGLAVQGVMSAIHTHIEENEEQHRVIKSSVETFKHEINSAIQTLEHEFDSDLETAKQEIIEVVDGFKVNLDFVASSVETLKAQTQTNKANAESAINTLNQSLNGVKSAVQTLDETVKALNFTDKDVVDIAQADTFVVTDLEGNTKKVSKKDISSDKPVDITEGDLDNIKEDGLYNVADTVLNKPQDSGNALIGVKNITIGSMSIVIQAYWLNVSGLKALAGGRMYTRVSPETSEWTEWKSQGSTELHQIAALVGTNLANGAVFISDSEESLTDNDNLVIYNPNEELSLKTTSISAIAMKLGVIEEKTLSKLEDKMYSLIYRKGWEKDFLDEVPNLKNIVPLDRVSVYGKNIAAIPDNLKRGAFLTIYNETTGVYNSAQIDVGLAQDIAVGKNYTLFYSDDATLVCIDHSKNIEDSSTYIKTAVNGKGVQWSIQRIPNQDEDEFIIMSGNIEETKLNSFYKYTPKTNTLELLSSDTGGVYGEENYPLYIGTFFYLNNAKTIVFATPAQAIVYNTDNMEESYEIRFTTSTGSTDTVLSDFVQLDDSTIGALYKDSSNNLRLLTISNNDLVTHKPADGTRYGQAVLAGFTQHSLGMSYIAGEKLVLRKLSDNYFAAHYKTVNAANLQSCDFTVFKWDNNKAPELALMSFKDLVITQGSSGIGFLGYNNFGLMYVTETSTGYMTYKTALNKFNV